MRYERLRPPNGATTKSTGDTRSEEFDQFAPGEAAIDQTAEGAASLHDTISSAFDRVEGTKSQSQSQSPARDGGSSSRTADQDAAPVRSEDDTAASKDTADKDTGTDAQDSAQSQASDPDLEAPAHWSMKDRETFSKIPRDAQAFLLERSKAMEAAHTQRSQEIAPLRNAADNWKGYLQGMNMQPEHAFNELMKVEYGLRTGTQAQKIGILRQLVNDYGIQAPQEGADQQENPQIAALQQQFQEFQNGQQNWQQQQVQAQQQQVQAEIEAFRTELTEAGKLAHPHFGEVESLMTSMAQADRAEGKQPHLKDLYERATWASPTVRPILLAQQQQEAAAKQAEAVKAKRNAGSTLSGAGSSTRAEQPMDLRATLEAAWDSVSAAA